MNKVNVELKGGLGNQLFQISTMMELVARIDGKITYSVDDLKYDSQRKFEGFFLIESMGFEECDKGFIKKWLHKNKYLHKVTSKVFGFFMPNKYISETRLDGRDPVSEIVLRVCNRKSSQISLNGYFQTIVYPEKYYQYIFELIKCYVTQSRETIKYLDEIRKTKLSVALHVRRGDYVSNSVANGFHGTCDPEYYISAVRHVMNQVACEDIKFYVFSDDLNWCEENQSLIGLSGQSNVVFVKQSKDADSFQDLLLIAECDWVVMANSTYSWWGAILGKDKNRNRVVMPSKWYADGTNNQNLINLDWSIL